MIRNSGGGRVGRDIENERIGTQHKKMGNPSKSVLPTFSLHVIQKSKSQRLSPTFWHAWKEKRIFHFKQPKCIKIYADTQTIQKIGRDWDWEKWKQVKYQTKKKKLGNLSVHVNLGDHFLQKISSLIWYRKQFPYPFDLSLSIQELSLHFWSEFYSWQKRRKVSMTRNWPNIFFLSIYLNSKHGVKFVRFDFRDRFFPSHKEKVIHFVITRHDAKQQSHPPFETRQLNGKEISRVSVSSVATQQPPKSLSRALSKFTFV